MDVAPLRPHVERYVKLDRYGRGRCPLHGGKNPSSLLVKDERWHCFTCNEGGWLVEFQAKLLDVPRQTAFQGLLADYGVDSTPTLTRAEYARLRARMALLERRDERARRLDFKRHTRMELRMEAIGDEALERCPSDPWSDEGLARAYAELADRHARSLVRLRERYGIEAGQIAPPVVRRETWWTPARVFGCLEEFKVAMQNGGWVK